MSRKRSRRGDPAPTASASSPGAAAPRRRREQTSRAGLGDGRGLRRLRLPQGARRRLRPARLPVDLAARPLRPGVPLRAAQRAADGLLPARLARPRGAAARDVRAGARRQRLAVSAVECCRSMEPAATREGGEAGAVRHRSRLRQGRARRRRWRHWSPSASAAARFASLAELAARVGAAPRHPGAARLGGRLRRPRRAVPGCAGAPARGAVAAGPSRAPARPCGEDTQLALPWSRRRRPGCARSVAGSG